MLEDEDCDDETRLRLTNGIHTMSIQMRGLVESLLELARADNGQIQKSMEHLNFSELCSDAILPYEPLYFEKGLMLEYNIADNIFVNGSDRYLRQLVGILLDNACKYSDAGNVEMKLSSQGSHCILTVSNPCAPIGKQELEDIFKRFYRTDNVRSMSHSYGLGLPIAKGIAEEHKGRISASYDNGKITFTVIIPSIK